MMMGRTVNSSLVSWVRVLEMSEERSSSSILLITLHCSLCVSFLLYIFIFLLYPPAHIFQIPSDLLQTWITATGRRWFVYRWHKALSKQSHWHNTNKVMLNGSEFH